MDWKKPLGAAVSDYTPNVAGFATVSFADYFGELTEADDLACLTLDTAGACDLKCEGMWYHHPSIRVTDREVSMRPLTRAIEDAWRTLAMKTLVVSGNEPFLNPRRL